MAFQILSLGSNHLRQITRQVANSGAEKWLKLAAAALFATNVSAALANDTVDQNLGVAAFASYTDASYAATEAARLQSLLNSPVLINKVLVNGTNFLRLQSNIIDRSRAQELVALAQETGYSSWFISTSKAPTYSAAPATSAARSVTTQPTVSQPKLMLTPDNPELALELPQGPLLGDLYPPREPRTLD